MDGIKRPYACWVKDGKKLKRELNQALRKNKQYLEKRKIISKSKTDVH